MFIKGLWNPGAHQQWAQIPVTAVAAVLLNDAGKTIIRTTDSLSYVSFESVDEIVREIEMKFHTLLGHRP